MGSWFVNYFSRRNASISVFDSNKSLLRASSQSVITAGSISECVSGADLVMVCPYVRLSWRLVRLHGRSICDDLRSRHASVRFRKSHRMLQNRAQQILHGSTCSFPSLCRNQKEALAKNRDTGLSCNQFQGQTIFLFVPQSPARQHTGCHRIVAGRLVFAFLSSASVFLPLACLDPL